MSEKKRFPEGAVNEAKERAEEKRDRAEDERDDAEARFHAIFDVNPAPALIVRLFDERVEMVNSGFLELTEYGRREVHRTRLTDLGVFTDPQQREALLDAPRHWQTLSKVEAQLRTKTGDQRTVLVSAKPLDLGEQACGVLTFADITEQVQAEQRFTKIFHLAPAPSCLVELEGGTFVDVNTSWLELTGHNKAEALRRSGFELGLWSPEVRAKLERALSRGGSFRDLELQICTKSGAVREVLVSAELLEDDPDLILLMLHDVTESKRNAEQFHRAIQEVLSDTAWFSQQIMERLANMRGHTDPTPSAELTNRERQVLEHLAAGQSNQQIADALGLATQTVRNYVASLYDKLEVNSRAEAVVWARQRGIIV